MNDTGSTAEIREEIDRAEAELRKVTNEEDRLVRLFVMDKLTEQQLSRQRKYITERQEAAEERLAGLRQQARIVEDRDVGLDSVREWIGRLAEGLADLDDKGRREVLGLVLDGVNIDGASNVRLDFAVPVEPVSVATSTISGARYATGLDLRDSGRTC